jgi:hypothetical protein
MLLLSLEEIHNYKTIISQYYYKMEYRVVKNVVRIYCCYVTCYGLDS